MLPARNTFKILTAITLSGFEVSRLYDKQFSVLRAMSTISHPTDMDEFLHAVGLSLDELVQELKKLTTDGFVKKTGKGYAITDKGRAAYTVFAKVPDENRFQFYFGMDQPAGVTARSIKEFYDIVGNIDLASLEFHLEREDFEKWFESSLKNDVFASELTALRQDGVKGEVLRKQILLGLQTRFGEDTLSQEWKS